MPVPWNAGSYFITPRFSLLQPLGSCLRTYSSTEISRNIDPLFAFEWNLRWYRKYWPIICLFSWGSKCILSFCSPWPGRLLLLWPLFCIPFCTPRGLLSDLSHKHLVTTSVLAASGLKTTQTLPVSACFWINRDHPRPIPLTHTSPFYFPSPVWLAGWHYPPCFFRATDLPSSSSSWAWFCCFLLQILFSWALLAALPIALPVSARVSCNFPPRVSCLNLQPLYSCRWIPLYL